MLLPFGTSAIFRNRWIALLWAAGICFAASEIVSSVSGVTDTPATTAQSPATPRSSGDDPVAVALGNGTRQDANGPPPSAPDIKY